MRRRPGIIEQIVSGAPLFSRVVVVGVCMGADRMRPSMAINKEIELRFVVAYTPLEFRDTLHMLAEGKVDASPLLTGVVGLPGVENAFDALASPRAREDPDRSEQPEPPTCGRSGSGRSPRSRHLVPARGEA